VIVAFTRYNERWILIQEDAAMAKAPGKKILQDEIERLEQLRDELRVQAHLMKADIKKEFQELEKKFDRVKKDAHPVRRAAEETVEEVSDATRLLFDTVVDGMKRVRKSIK
jgi:vacuolar-type H+-ATPase subunit E/Vma4